MRTYLKDKYADYRIVDVSETMRAINNSAKQPEVVRVTLDNVPCRENFLSISEDKPTKNETTVYKILEALQYGFMSEPEKTFRKLGIIDTNNVITNEGVRIFLTYILKNGSTEGFGDYAKKLLKETDKKEN